jgi:hypothetical protein
MVSIMVDMGKEDPIVLVYDEYRISLQDFLKIESELYVTAFSKNLRLFKSYTKDISGKDQFLVMCLN